MVCAWENVLANLPTQKRVYCLAVSLPLLFVETGSEYGKKPV